MPRMTPEQKVAAARVLACDALARGIDRRSDQDLVAIALVDYKLRYPECGDHGAGRTRRGPPPFPWMFYDGDPTTKRISRKYPPKRVDVFCLFCRVLLVSDAKLDIDYTERVRSHTTHCALMSLAGLMTPGAPYTYRLPGEL